MKRTARQQGPTWNPRNFMGKYSGARLERRTLRVPKQELLEIMRKMHGGPFKGAAALVSNDEGEVLLVRHKSSLEWGNAWVTPGGVAKEGESPEEALVREVREETGLDVEIDALTKIFEVTLTDGEESMFGHFYQFEARAVGGDLVPGHDILEAKWFDHLPKDMAFREDYLQSFEMRKRKR